MLPSYARRLLSNTHGFNSRGARWLGEFEGVIGRHVPTIPLFASQFHALQDGWRDRRPQFSVFMWERTLQDLIRGLRANKKDEATFINKAVGEIREEIKSKDMELKAGAVMKLTYVSITLRSHPTCLELLLA